MTFLTLHSAAIASLRQTLTCHNYAALLQAVDPAVGHQRAFCEFGFGQRASEQLPVHLATLLRLFALGERVPVKLVHKVLEPAATEGLIECGFLCPSPDGEVETAGYTVVGYRGYFCVADLPPQYPTAKRLRREVVVDDDTLALAGFLAHTRGECFVEACAGAGLLSIVASARAATVVGGDLSPKVIAAAQFNAALNGVADRVRFVESDLFQNLPARGAATLAVNPPFVPLLDYAGAPYLAGDGGRDGLTLVRRCLAALPELLAQEASALVIAGDFARDGLVHCAEELRSLALNAGLRIHCIVINDSSVEQMAHTNAIAMPRPSEYAEAVLAQARALGAERYQVFVLRMRRAPNARGLTFIQPALPAQGQRAALHSVATQGDGTPWLITGWRRSR